MGALAEAEALKSTVDALVLGVVRELEATNAVKGVGWASTQDFVTSVAGGHKGAGHATVRLATAVNEPLLAPVGEAMTDGWLSATKAQVIVSAIDALPGDLDTRTRGMQAMLDSAKGLDATDLRRVGRRLVETVDPDGQARREERELDRVERAAHLSRNLSITFDGAGGCWIKGRCSAEDGANLRTTLLPLARAPTCCGGGLQPHLLRCARLRPRRSGSSRPRRPAARCRDPAVRPSCRGSAAARVPWGRPAGVGHHRPRRPEERVRVRPPPRPAKTSAPGPCGGWHAMPRSSP